MTRFINYLKQSCLEINPKLAKMLKAIWVKFGIPCYSSTGTIFEPSWLISCATIVKTTLIKAFPVSPKL